MELKDNAVEFITGQKTITVTFSAQKYINKIDRYYADRPDDFIRYLKNEDGSVCATLPLSWLKISPPRKMSDEQREAAAIRLRESKLNKS